MNESFNAVIGNQIKEFAYTFPTLAKWEAYLAEAKEIAATEGITGEDFNLIVTGITMDELPDDFAYLRKEADIEKRKAYMEKFNAEQQEKNRKEKEALANVRGEHILDFPDAVLFRVRAIVEEERQLAQSDVDVMEWNARADNISKWKAGVQDDFKVSDDDMNYLLNAYRQERKR